MNILDNLIINYTFQFQKLNENNLYYIKSINFIMFLINLQIQ